ncbi:MAG: TlpA family protein disulfide reductase [Minisyncoccales bacterium]
MTVMKKITIILTILLLLLSFNFVFAQDNNKNVEINFFYSKTCPHCAKEAKFLDKIEDKYPSVQVNRYLINENTQRLKDFFEEYDISQDNFGVVPATFVNDEFFLGFDNENGIGSKIEKAIQGELNNNFPQKGTSSQDSIKLPLIGKINPSQYSLPVLTIIMGTIDGFNVCSLGVLVLILGLVLSLKSRTKLILYGGAFLFTTAVVYGILIFFWYKLFQFFSEWISIMQFLIGLLATGGGIYLLKEFIKFHKQGAPTCEISDSKFVNRFSNRVKKVIQKDTVSLFTTLGTILLFAVVITVVEFPCSAAAPLVFTGILSEANVTGFSYVGYIALFVLFYLLDEIFIFGIAVWKMSIWMSSPKFVKWSTLAGAIVMLGIAAYYFILLV